MEELEILPLLLRMLQMCGTSSKSYVEVLNGLRLLTGDFVIHNIAGSDAEGSYTSWTLVRTKMLQEYFSPALDLVREILTDSVVLDTDRIRDCITDLITTSEQDYSYSANYWAANYAASKAGLIALAKSIGQEMGPKGIRANAIAPGFIDTAMTQALPDDIRKEWINKIPLRRGGQVEDIANVATFLASDMSSYVSGQVIQVDGGMNM